MDPLRVFLSYRRDSDHFRASMMRMIIRSAAAPREGEREVQVFQDVEQRLGRDWPQEVRTQLAEADIVVAVIGPGWLAAKDANERRRIDSPDDWVRNELEVALAARKTVIPVVSGGEMPTAEALPEAIAGLVHQSGLLVPENFSDHDLQPLLLEITRQRRPQPTATAKPAAAGRLPYPDPPLKVRPAPLSKNEVDEALAEMLDGWDVVESDVPEEPGKRRVELHREFEFDSFGAVLDFMQRARPFIDEMNHHPRWENLYHTLRVFLTTWDIGHRISYLDVILAGHLDRTAARTSKVPYQA
jgi:pterin-4a-carbinolamine dehydratase